MGLEHLLKSLERNAREEAERILAQARAESEELARHAADQAVARRTESVAVRERELGAQAARTLGAARRDSRQAMLEARQRFLDRMRTAVRERAARAEPEPGHLGPRLDAALACFGDAPVEVRAGPGVGAAVRAFVGDRPNTVVVAAEDGEGVMVVRAADGSMEVDASLVSLVERRWPSLVLDLLRAIEEPA